MTDLWSFLLQTLTASGAAVLLLAVKALFRDKLSPRWQFGVWALLGLTLLLPAGEGGRYVLLNWPLWLETAKTALTGDYGLTRVLAPFPLPAGFRQPFGWAEALYGLYLLGAALLLGRYALSYVRLRRALGRGCPAEGLRLEQMARVAETYGLETCPAAEVPGLPTAFICGFFRPVLVFPAGVEVDDKVLLHELLHLKHRDVGWGLLLCLLRCLHWCNPLLWCCFDRAQNDLEALCDQRVLERLEGEARRDYGRILLSMADDRYARAPGTSSMANGGRNIRARITSIARFRRYPAGMALASVCVAVILALPILLGDRAGGVVLGSRGHSDRLGLATAMASARTTRCSTAAGALDAYGKAVLAQNGVYRALCAPLEDHPALAEELWAAASGPERWIYTHWESGLPGHPDAQKGYYLFNLAQDGTGVRAELVVPILWAREPGGSPAPESDGSYVGVQTVRAERRGDRWVVLPLEDFRLVETTQSADDRVFGLSWGEDALAPAAVYAGDAERFHIELRYQTVYMVDNNLQTGGDMSWMVGSAPSFDTTPKPHASFTERRDRYALICSFTGTEEERARLGHVGASAAPLDADGSWPKLETPVLNGSGSSNDGSMWFSKAFPQDGAGVVSDGAGSGSPVDEALPAAFALELYVNGAPVGHATLLPREGGTT